ncbi:MAG: DUF4340 domain-containing protein [Deltaproteobacteria bacterium]|nr:DUF4340 domain-containing protein [Deltaproteobacteria bacterium]
MKKHAVTLALVAIAVLLGVWLFLDRDSVTEDERKKRENNVFVAWRRDELRRLVIAHDNETITLERDAAKDASWRMKSPRDERVDTAAMERLLTTLEFATVQRKIGESPATLGFDAPRAHGEVQMGAMVVRFALGGASPRPEGSGYLRIDDRPPVVVSKEVVSALLAPADTYRDRTVVPYLSIDLSKLELRHAAGSVTLERHDERSFKVASRGVLASRNGLDRLWNALAEMRAEAFPKDADVDRLTAAPKLTMIMTPKDAGKPAGELVIGEACPGQPNDVVVLRKSPTKVAACAPKSTLEALLVDADTLVDKQLFSVKFDEVEEVRLELLGAAGGAGTADGGSGPRAIEAARRGTGFHLREPADRDLDAGEADAMTELLGRLTDAAASSVERAGAPFTAYARARLRFGDHEEVVEVASPGEKGVAIARRAHDGALLTIAPEVVRRLLPRETTFRPRGIFAEQGRRVSKLVFRCGLPQELVDDGGGFRMVEPKGYEVSGKVRQIVDALTRGKIDTWVSDVDDGSFGFGAAETACRVVVAFADGNAPATITFGAEGESGIYGKVDTRAGVFVAPKSMHKWMTEIHVSETSLRYEFDRVERVRTTFRGREVAIRQPLMKEAMGRIVATPVAFGRAAIAALPPPELVIEVFPEGGASARVQCRPPLHPETRNPARRCTKDGSEVVFEVVQSSLFNLLPQDVFEAAERDASVPGAGDAAADARSP